MFTNEEKKQFQHCTVEDQVEIFKAFLEGRTHYYDPVAREWELATIINPTAIYRTIPPAVEDGSEGATPIKGIPWEVIDRKWSWAAMDDDGCVCFYEHKPARYEYTWSAVGNNGDYFFDQGFFNISKIGIDWTTSLTKRPEHR